MKIDNLYIPDKEFIFDYVKSSGPGGQNVNKVNSKVVMRWNLLESNYISESLRKRFLEKWGNRVSASGELVLASDQHRDQIRNKEAVEKKFFEMLRQVQRPPKKRVATKPSARSVRKRLEQKKKRGQLKADRAKKWSGS